MYKGMNALHSAVLDIQRVVYGRPDFDEKRWRYVVTKEEMIEIKKGLQAMNRHHCNPVDFEDVHLLGIKLVEV